MTAVDRRLGRVLLAAAVFLLSLRLLLPAGPRHLKTSHPQINFRPSSFDWTSVAQRYPVSSIRPLPTGRPKQFPPVQHAFRGYVHDATTKRRQEAVRAAFVRSWDSYKTYAWLQDELAPVSGGGKTTFGGWAATLVDSLDTLWIMGLEDEFYVAAAAAAQLDWANTTETAVNVFETTIRHLGGLLGAYELSGVPALLKKATELGDMLYMAFDTPNRIPGFWLNFQNAKQGLQTAGTNDPSASPCSLSLEFTRLSLLTGDAKFYDAVARISDFLERTQSQSKLPGMWPKLINFHDETVDDDNGFTLGALADSLYEYLPKMAALLGGRVPSYEKMYRAAMRVAKEHLLFRPMVAEHDEEGRNILFAGDAYVHPDHIDHVPEGQHLSCFTGGMFALGGKLFNVPDHVAIGERLARGCAWAYDAFPTGLMPEIFNIVPCSSIDGPCPWDEERWQKEGDQKLKKGFKNARDPRYILRPEAIESVFLLYRMTGKEDLRDLAWRMFEAVMGATKTALANSAIADVTVEGETTKTDSMESFFLAETLKYFYLIFSPPDLINLDEFVLNTEAHPLRRAK
ncbi:087370f7-07de-420c-a5bf-ba3c0a36ffff [Thermothielavioides terrestris]|uniref:alpha-1,2-Mannosidase n=2 Tax=Thermothielavioides terrestris TaxID=2587410 RepID=G2R391_THETT|nr:glycoside hydrolase family 47 protein [Thermothielavioides terrestris NRRL 8126]AEO65097.1 glycoside hydrolase family 47 protein [Thermothielavioides terrestris NRRL 8126]SPQ19646.1 087370f7-07de-420c-a5bf-ba3c0a36ffff [Thermothielavioides terrestris]